MVNASKPVIVVILFLALTLVYHSVAFAVKKTTGTPDNPECEFDNDAKTERTCCWNQPVGQFGNTVVVCQHCILATNGQYRCESPYCPNSGFCPKTGPQFGTKAPTSGGTLEQPEPLI